MSTFFGFNQRSFTSYFSQKWVRILALTLGVIVLIFIICGLYTSIQKRPWRAVFLANGQVYFGKFVPPVFSRFGSLTDIYYLQTSNPVQSQSSSPAPTPPVSVNQNGQNLQPVMPKEEPSLTVVKLGNEIHAPEDEMFISSEAILFWENIRDDGDVVSTIKRYTNARSK